MYHGDIRLGDTIDIKFTTRNFSTGAPFTLAGTPSVAAYPGNSTTGVTAGITLSVDFDARTGLNNVRVVASSGNGYATATNYTLVITAGTVNGVSVVGECIGSFSIEARSALMPATAGRTAVVDAAGLIDANAVKAGPTGAGTALTARDIGASVLLSAGTGPGQLDFSSGIVKANLVSILGTALTETAGQIAAAFKQFFDVASPTGNMKAITSVVTATNTTTVNGLAANVITAASINAAALNGKGDWNIGKTGYALSSAGIQALWDALTSALATAGSIGKLLVDNVNATISSRLASASYTAPLDAAGTRAAVGLAAADLDTQLSNLPTAGENADAVWDEDATAHQTQGTFGQAIGDPGADANTIFKAVVTDATGATVGADVVAVKAETANILADTAEIGVAGAGLSNITLPNGSLTAAKFAAGAFDAVWSVATRLLTAGTNIVLAKGTGLTGLNDISQTAVKNQVVDALNVDTYAEPGQEAPPATTTLVKKIGYLYKAWRNKSTQTGSEYKLFADDGTTVDQKSTVTDDGNTFTSGEKGVGP